MARVNEKRTKEYREVNNKSVVITWRGTPAEKADLERLAKADGRSLSDYIRRAVRLRNVRKKRDPIKATLLAEVEKLRRDHAGLARNFNQLVAAAHSRRSYPPDAWLAAQEAAIQQASKAVDRLMFGGDDDR